MESLHVPDIPSATLPRKAERRLIRWHLGQASDELCGTTRSEIIENQVQKQSRGTIISLRQE
jgi:hypothetical protein